MRTKAHLSSPFSSPARRLARPFRWLLGAALAQAMLWSSSASADPAAGVSDERVSLPDGPGSLGGLGNNVAITPHMGTMTYSVPVLTPEGFPGLAPSLDLSYSSGAGSGVLGLGWSIAMPSIERMTSRGLPLYSPDDLFAADGGSELVKVSASGSDATYRARYEGGFVRYTWHSVGNSGYWTAEFPDGRVSYYGAGVDGKPVDSAQVKTPSGGVFRYLLVATVDPFGHQLRYAYQKSSGGYPLLDEITYLFDDANTPRYSVRFAYEAREDLISDGSPGFELLLDKRLQEIRVSSGGTQIRRVRLQYEEYGKSGGSSRVASVEQFGLNDTPDPIRFTFAYSQALGGGCADESCGKPFLVSMGTLPGNVLLNAGKATLLDINGDALPDVLATDPQSGKHTFYLNKMGTDGKPSFSTTAVNSTQGSSSLILGLPAVQVMDLNGDGFTDIVNAKTRDVRCNNGSGDWAPTPFCLGTSGSGDMFSDKFSPADDPNDTGQDPLHVRFFDFDRDRKIDWLRTETQGSTVVSRNTGSGFEAVTVEPIGEVFDEGTLQLADMNGDGLQDPVMIQTTGTVRYRLNLGRGKWTDWHQVSLPGLDATQLAAAKLEDINGDSLSDIVIVSGNEVRYLLNRNGDHFDKAVIVDSSKVTGGIPNFDPSSMTVSFADMNGNGSSDVVWISGSGAVQFLELFPIRPNLLTRIDNGIGFIQKVSYGTSVVEQARDLAEGKPWKYKLPNAMTVVTGMDTWVSLTGSDSGGLHEVMQYRYNHGYYDGAEAQFRGYERVETERLGDAAKDSQDPGLTVQVTDIGKEDRYHNGLPLQTQSYALVGGQRLLLREERTEYGECPVAEIPASGLNVPVRFVCPKATTEVISEGDPSQAVTKRSEQSYDGYGNVTLQSALGVIHRGTPEAPQSCGSCPEGAPFGQLCGDQCTGDELITETKFVIPGKDTGGAWQLRKAWSEVMYGSSGGPRKETLTYYDGPAFEGLPQGALTRGFISRVTQRVGPGATEVIASSRSKSDPHGNAVETLDPLGDANEPNAHRRQYTYDKWGKRVIRAEMFLKDAAGNPYSLRRDVVYEPLWDKISEGTAWMNVEGGQPTSPRDSTLYRYDDLGRTLKLIDPGETEEKPGREVAYDFNATRIQLAVRSRSVADGPLDQETIQCLDGKGRKYQERTRLAAGSYQVSGFVEFNKLGKPVREYQPHLGTSAACDTVPPQNVLFTTYRYDALDRLVETTHPDGTVTQQKYLPLAEVISDENDTDPQSPHHNTPTIRQTDGQGRVVAIERQLQPGSISSVLVEYDSLGRMTAYVDADGNRHEQAYDLLDRVVQIKDANAGIISTEYDAAGNVLRRTDARGVAVRSSYDGNNRVIATWNEADEAGTRYAVTYDLAGNCADCAHTAGRPARLEFPLGKDALSPIGSTRFSYDAKGRRVFEVHSLEGHDFKLTHTLDNTGRKVKTTYPDGQEMQWSYDPASRITAMPGVIPAITYDERGSLIRVDYANGASTERDYDERLRLKSTRTTAAGKVLFGTTLTLDNVGTVMALEDLAAPLDGRPSSQGAFAYDAWYRLREATLGAGTPEKLTYSYDELDRVLSAESSLGAASPAQVGALSYDKNNKPLAARAYRDSKLDYDASGNLSARAGLTFERDLFGRVSRVLQGDALQESIAYKMTGARVLKLEQGGATYLIGDDFELRDGVSVLYARAGKTRLARTTNDKLAALVLSDLAPATESGGTFTPTGDSHIDAGDVWLAQAAESGAVKLASDAKPSPVARLLRASARRLLMESSEATTFLHHDHLGSLVLSTSSKGDVLAEQAFYPFGQVRASSGFVDRYGFTGQEHDDNTGLIHFKFRELDPISGRWTEVDPAFLNLTPDQFLKDEISDLTTAYGYVGNDPVTAVDPDGLNKFRAAALAVVAVKHMESLRTQVQNGTRISNSATVCRGGTCEASKLANGTGVTNNGGVMQGLSANAGASVVASSTGIPNGQIGVTSARAIRHAGGEVTPDRTPQNPNHVLVSGISAEHMSNLVRPTMPNPHQANAHHAQHAQHAPSSQAPSNKQSNPPKSKK